MAMSVKKNGVAKGTFAEAYEYIKLSPGCYIDTGIYVAHGDTIEFTVIAKYETGESGRDLMGFSGNGKGYWGASDDEIDWQRDCLTTIPSDIYNPFAFKYVWSSVDSAEAEANVQIGALSSAFSTRTKYIYRFEAKVNGVLVGEFVPVDGGMYNLVTGELKATNNSDYTLGDKIEKVQIYDNLTECNEIIEL